MCNKYLIIDSQILPDTFQKVLQIKEMLSTGKVKDISEAAKIVGISRSTFYKYKDCVFAISENIDCHRVTFSILLIHKAGALSMILDTIAKYHGNILTISQNIPINNTANVTITFDISELSIEFKQFMDILNKLDSVIKTNIITIE